MILAYFPSVLSRLFRGWCRSFDGGRGRRIVVHRRQTEYWRTGGEYYYTARAHEPRKFLEASYDRTVWISHCTKHVIQINLLCHTFLKWKDVYFPMDYVILCYDTNIHLALKFSNKCPYQNCYDNNVARHIKQFIVIFISFLDFSILYFNDLKQFRVFFFHVPCTFFWSY